MDDVNRDFSSWLRAPGHKAWLAQEGNRLLGFARAAKLPQGFGNLDDHGRLPAHAVAETMNTARMTHSFALAHINGIPGCAEWVDHGVAALAGPLRDAEHGGWFAKPLEQGADTGKAAYLHAFVALAASSAVVARRPGAQALLDQAQLFEGHADAMSAGEEGHLTLAVEESLIGEPLEELIVDFEAEFPQLELELLNPARSDIIRLIEQGRVDIGLLISILDAPKGFRILPLREMIMVAVASPKHPLAAFDLLTFDELIHHRQLVLTSRDGDVLPNEQLSHSVWKIESQYGLVDLVRRSLGWAWAPQHMVQGLINDGELKMLSLEGGCDQYHRPVDLITSATYREGKAGQWLCERLPQLSFFV